MNKNKNKRHIDTQAGNENDQSNALARRHPSKSQDYKGESQNVEDDGSGRLEGEQAQKARNKATEGFRQGRDNDVL
jgi:hypothetical protein